MTSGVCPVVPQARPRNQAAEFAWITMETDAIYHGTARSPHELEKILRVSGSGQPHATAQVRTLELIGLAHNGRTTFLQSRPTPHPRGRSVMGRPFFHTRIFVIHSISRRHLSGVTLLVCEPGTRSSTSELSCVDPARLP